MQEISREWYKKVFDEYVVSEYGSFDVLKKYNQGVEETIRKHMYKEITRKFSFDSGEVPLVTKTNQKLCNEFINKYRHEG